MLLSPIVFCLQLFIFVFEVDSNCSIILFVFVYLRNVIMTYFPHRTYNETGLIISLERLMLTMSRNYSYLMMLCLNIALVVVSHDLVIITTLMFNYHGYCCQRIVVRTGATGCSKVLAEKGCIVQLNLCTTITCSHDTSGYRSSTLYNRLHQGHESCKTLCQGEASVRHIKTA